MLYRAINKDYYPDSQSKEKYIVELYPEKTARVPSNIPYVVDNIWEYLRPNEMPSRRHATYASPRKELALKYANDNSTLCGVMASVTTIAAQITNYDDARLHPDVKLIPKIIFKHLGQEWIDSNIELKTIAGKLFIPALKQSETAEIINAGGDALISMIDEIKEKSTFWQDCHLFDAADLTSPDNKLTTGEVFFHSPDGYYLIEQEK